MKDSAAPGDGKWWTSRWLRGERELLFASSQRRNGSKDVAPSSAALVTKRDMNEGDRSANVRIDSAVLEKGRLDADKDV